MKPGNGSGIIQAMAAIKFCWKRRNAIFPGGDVKILKENGASVPWIPWRASGQEKLN